MQRPDRGIRFAHDSPLEEGVSSELVSEAKFPASREFTGNFIELGLGGASTAAKKGIKPKPYRANSLRIRTGNFLRPCREFKSAIREISGLIRESRSRPLFRAFCPADQSDLQILPRDLDRLPRRTHEVPPPALYVSAPMRRNSRFIAFTWARYVATSWSPQRSPRDQIGRLRQPRHSSRIVLAPPEPARHANLEPILRDVLLRCPVLVFRLRRGKRPPM